MQIYLVKRQSRPLNELFKFSAAHVNYSSRSDEELSLETSANSLIFGSSLSFYFRLTNYSAALSEAPSNFMIDVYDKPQNCSLALAASRYNPDFHAVAL